LGGTGGENWETDPPYYLLLPTKRVPTDGTFRVSFKGGGKLK